MTRTSMVAVVGILLVASACAADGSGGLGPSASDTTSTTASNVGGEVIPVQRSFEEYPHDSGPITGVVELRADGCWTMDVGDGPTIAVFPVDYTMSLDDEMWTMGLPDGTRFASGTDVSGVGGPMDVALLPGGTDGFWGGYLTFCDADAEQVVILDSLAAVPEPPDADEMAAMLEEAALDTSWPCGLGFTVSNTDQTVEMYFWPRDASDEILTPVRFPDPAWVGEVVIGENLLVNHCDDVVEPQEPERIVYATYPITGGTLTFDVPATECGSPPVEAILVGISVEGARGTVTFGDLTVVNTAYGCFAG